MISQLLSCHQKEHAEAETVLHYRWFHDFTFSAVWIYHQHRKSGLRITCEITCYDSLYGRRDTSDTI
jgi:hypothetical protein